MSLTFKTFNSKGEVVERSLETVIKDCLRNEVQQKLRNRETVEGLYPQFMNEIDKAIIEELLILTRGNQTRAAKYLSINRGTLRKKMENLGFI